MRCRVVNSLISPRRETVTTRYLFFSSLPQRTRGIREITIGRGFHHLLIPQHHIIPSKNSTFPCIFHDTHLPASSNNRFYGNTCSISNNTIKDDAIDKSQQREDSKVGIIEGDLIPPILNLRNRIDEIRLSRKSSISRKSHHDHDHASDEATNCLRQIFRWYGDKVNISDCNKVIGILSMSRKREALEKAFDVFNHVIEVYEKSGNKSLRPNVITYNSVISAFAQKGDIDGSRKIFEMQVHDFEMKDNLKAKPNDSTFLKMMYACSQSTATNAPEIAFDLLTTTIDWHKKGKLKDGLPASIYIAAMNACARKGDVERATSIMQMMENDVNNMLHSRVYGILINAWSKSGHHHAPQQAKNLLIGLSIMFINGISEEGPNTITYTSVMDTYAASGDIQGACDILDLMEDDFKSGNNDAKPNMISYSTLINAISKSGKENAPRQAMNILKKVIDLHSKGYLDEGPDTITYTSVMDAYAAEGDGEGANDIFMMMELDKNTKPNARAYGSLINAWSRSDSDNAHDKVESILKEMNRHYKSSCIEEGPNNITYRCMIKCLRKFKGTEHRIRELKSLMKPC
jgi:pentatricopeptide repeat protein